MEFWQLTDLLILLFVGAAVMIPVVGLTARFAIGPLIEKFARSRSTQVESLAGELGALRFEVDELRDGIRELQTEIRRLRDVSNFERQLKS